MQGRNSGYFLVHRSTFGDINPVLKSLVEASLWLYMVSSASHKDKTLDFLHR
jgi:hypothetical protein